MKLIDILTIYDENENLTVVDKNDDWLATYDGKNSIDEDLNEYEVIKIYPLSADTTVVMINR